MSVHSAKKGLFPHKYDQIISGWNDFKNQQNKASIQAVATTPIENWRVLRKFTWIWAPDEQQSLHNCKDLDKWYWVFYSDRWSVLNSHPTWRTLGSISVCTKLDPPRISGSTAWPNFTFGKNTPVVGVVWFSPMNTVCSSIHNLLKGVRTIEFFITRCPTPTRSSSDP